VYCEKHYTINCNWIVESPSCGDILLLHSGGGSPQFPPKCWSALSSVWQKTIWCRYDKRTTFASIFFIYQWSYSNLLRLLCPSMIQWSTHLMCLSLRFNRHCNLTLMLFNCYPTILYWIRKSHIAYCSTTRSASMNQD